MLGSVIASKAERLPLEGARACLAAPQSPRNDAGKGALLLIPVNFAGAAGIAGEAEDAMLAVDGQIDEIPQFYRDLLTGMATLGRERRLQISTKMQARRRAIGAAAERESEQCQKFVSI